MPISRSIRSLIAVCAVLGFAAAGPTRIAAQGIDDLGNTLDPDKPAKKTAPAKTPPKPPKKTPASTPKATPAKKVGVAPTYKPGEEPGAKPLGGGGPPTARPAGGIWIAGNHYASLDEFMFGMWRWRNNNGQLMHLSFFRNKTFLAFNTVTQVRVYGRFWSVGNRQLYVDVTRVCRFRQCRPPPRRVRRSFPTYPLSANVVRNGNERWTRIRRY